SGQTANEQQVTELSTKLSSASTRVEEAKARLDQAAKSPTVAALRAKYAGVLRREAELATHLGPRHPSLIDIREQARDFRQAIDREPGRLTEAARGDYDRARATQEALERRLAALRSEVASTNQTMARLRDLDRDAEASRAVYQAFLARLRGAGEDRFSTANVRVLAEGKQPAEKSWAPAPLLLLAAALAFGAAAGAGLGAVRDRSDDRIRSRHDLEAACALPILAEIPGVLADHAPGDWRTRMLAKARAHRQGVTLMASLLDA